MTETREQWIEREARKARERYWGGIGDWDSDGYDIRQDWRNVVAPFYPEPVRVPVDVDGLARAIFDGLYGESRLYDAGIKAMHVAAARIALAYLNIEPCDKPEYNPADVALTPNERAELENLRAEVKNQSKTIKAMRKENAKLRVEASEATAKAERQRKQLDANRKTIESRGAEIARLENEVKRLRTQQPETRPVRVRFDVTVEDVSMQVNRLHADQHNQLGTVKGVMDYLAAHAVIDVPPGTQRREWTGADVDELAKELALAYHRGVFRNTLWEELGVDSQEDYRREASAALGWFDGKRGEV